MEIAEVVDFSPEVAAAMRRLLLQLSASASPPSDADIERIVASPASRLLVARDGEAVVGMLTLALFPLPSGIRAWIEDVVVDERGRGRGIGEALNRAALDLARREGARTVDLTSRPSRTAANRLYQRIGFVPRETNVYRLELDAGSGDPTGSDRAGTGV